MRPALFRSLILLCLVTGTAPAAEEPARLVVHLLTYIGSDYGGAVRDGKITSRNEYNEQKEFLKSAVEAAQEVPVLRADKEIVGGLAQLQKLVDKLGPSEKVAAVALAVSERTLRLTGLHSAPASWPNLVHGKELFEKTCAQCHGATGHGDGPQSAGLNPKPTDFHGDKMSDISPFQAFNTIRLGVPGTAMAGFSSYSEAEVWDLAFYVLRFRYGEIPEGYRGPAPLTKVTLTEAATRSDKKILESLPGTAAANAPLVANVRMQSSKPGDTTALIALSRERLHDAGTLAARGDWKGAKEAAVVAYLDGVEPLEPRLRVLDPALTTDIELAMAAVRSAIDAHPSDGEMAKHIAGAETQLDRVAKSLATPDVSPSFTFTVAFGIVLREAFEAVLVIITLLGVLRAMGARSAVLYVHAGWISALGLGLVVWFFSGWLVGISGAQRELLEGGISVFAVGVLLYFGFWLHRRTEIGKWRAFINEMVKTAVDGKRLVVLGGVAFMAVFREAFETVLFLRALLIEAGPHQQAVMGAGVLAAFLLVLALSALVVRYSVKIPVRQLFAFSSIVMVALAVILIGKGLHSFQETGLLTVTRLPVRMSLDLLGLYPTYETFVPQLIIVGASVLMWLYGRRALRLKERTI